MASAIPSLAAFGGARGIGKQRPKPKDGKQILLSELNKDYARMVDTYIYDYPQLVRDCCDPFANVTDDSVKVAVIGAGFAGATAVYELQRAGITDITVYEGRGRIGGRADSPTFTDEEGRAYINELGPMRVPENSKLFWHYLSEVVKKDDPEADPFQTIFPNPGVVATQLIYRGIPYTWKDEDYPQPPAGANPEDLVDWEQLYNDIGEFLGSLTLAGITYEEVAAFLRKETLTEAEKTKIHIYWSYFLEKFDYMSFVAALEEFFGDRWGAEQYNMFSTLGLGTGGFGPLFPVCFLEILRLFLWEYQNEYSPHISMTEIVEKLIAETPMRYETVTYVGIKHDDPNKVNVHSINPLLKSADRTAVETYDYVIVATTLRSMQIGMNLDANVAPTRYSGSTAVFGGDANEMMRESLRIPHIMNSSKLFGFLSQKPWVVDPDNWPHHPAEGGEPVKCVLTDTLARQMYYLDPYEMCDDAGSNVLISYNWGDDSVKIMGILDYEEDQVSSAGATSNFNLKEAYETGLETAIADSPVAASLKQITINNQEDHLVSVVWQQEPLIFGAFKLDYPNQYYYVSQLAYQYHYASQVEPEQSKRVYLAGNNISFQGGWIEGAMQSAVNAVSAVLLDMSTNGQATNFRMNALFCQNPFQNVLDTLGERYLLPPISPRSA
ncbi:MAG: NAD(P)-binding protein [Gammaproteobacteria bacterium]|nr:NAD(P)-binding protein [Gammaproteobacteria bacterium]